jgi:hypothetical protein
MTNKINYNNYPDKNEFVELYSSHTQQQLAKHYGCNKARIRKWIDYFGLQRRIRGGGNNKKYNINEEQLKKLVDEGYSNIDIMTLLNIKSVSVLNSWLKKYKIKRKYNKKEQEIYTRKVRYLTELEYSKYHEEINPKNYPRTLCGVEGGYQLDHIIGIMECFKLGLSSEDAASKKNLQMLPWKDNLNKRMFHKNNKDNK